MSITRRGFLGVAWKAVAIGGGGALLAACAQPAPTPTPAPASTQAPAATSAPAAKPTTAPTAAPGATAATAPTNAPAATPTPAAAAAAAAKGPVELQVVNVLFFTPEIDKTLFPPGYALFSKQNEGRITVKETLVPEDNQEYTKILTMVAGGTAPDLAYIHPSRGLPQFVGGNVVVPLDEYIKADRTVALDDIYEGPLSYYRYPIGAAGAKIYGLPFYSGPMMIAFNKKIFSQNGEKTPDAYEKEGKWTWETLLDVGKRLTKGTGATKTFGLQSVSSDLTVLYPIVCEYGGQVWDEAMNRTLLGEPPASDTLEFQASLQYQHQIVPGAAEVQGLPGGFMAGRTGIMSAIKADIPRLVDAAKQGKVDPGIAPMPKGSKGRFIRNGPNSYCVLTASKAREESWKLINFMTQLDFQQPWMAVSGTLPIRKSLLTSGAFAKSLQPWEDINVYTEASQLDKPLQVTTNFIDINTLFKAEFDLVKLGKETYKEAAAKIVPKIDALLKKAKEG